MCFNCYGKHRSQITCPHTLVRQIKVSPTLTVSRCCACGRPTDDEIQQIFQEPKPEYTEQELLEWR